MGFIRDVLLSNLFFEKSVTLNWLPARENSKLDIKKSDSSLESSYSHSRAIYTAKISPAFVRRELDHLSERGYCYGNREIARAVARAQDTHVPVQFTP